MSHLFEVNRSLYSTPALTGLAYLYGRSVGIYWSGQPLQLEVY